MEYSFSSKVPFKPKPETLNRGPCSDLLVFMDQRALVRTSTLMREQQGPGRLRTSILGSSSPLLPRGL